MHKLGVELIPYARLFGADGDTVYFHHNASGEPIICEGVDTLVIAQGHKQNTTLEEEISGLGLETYLVGDCLSPLAQSHALMQNEPPVVIRIWNSPTSLD